MKYPMTITMRQPWYKRVKKQAPKIIFYQLILLSLLGNVWFAKQFYVARCSAGGWFMSKQACGEIAGAKQDATIYASETARLEWQVEELRTNQLNQ